MQTYQHHDQARLDNLIYKNNESWFDMFAFVIMPVVVKNGAVFGV